MHELGIAHSILQPVLKNAEEQGGLRVTSVRLRIGELAQVVPDSLQFGFECLSRNTLAEGAELEIVEVPLRWTCRSCTRTQPTPADACPNCGAALDREGAHEIILESIEMDDAPSEVPHGQSPS
jgi:hydrogenase nickel incorporation protein HypA/HybF